MHDCKHHTHHDPLICQEIDRLDKIIAEEHGEDTIGFNEDFLLAMEDADVLDTYHEADSSTNEERIALLVAMTKYAKFHQLIPTN